MGQEPQIERQSSDSEYKKKTESYKINIHTSKRSDWSNRIELIENIEWIH